MSLSIMKCDFVIYGVGSWDWNSQQCINGLAFPFVLVGTVCFVSRYRCLVLVYIYINTLINFKEKQLANERDNRSVWVSGHLYD